MCYIRMCQGRTNYLNDFRVEACPLFKQHQCQQHRPYTCFNWHFANQRRRRPVKKSDGSFNYSPDIYCDKYDENTGICPDGDDCVYLHRVSGDVERKYHLRYYKTAQCVHPTDSRGQCVKNGAHCAFAHSSNDLRLPLFDQHEAGFATTIEGDARDKTSFVIEDQSWHNHVLSCYKTEQCRKPARLCRQGYACPFYHNTKDRRRPPAMFKYRSTPCPAAKTVDEWLDPELCEAGDNCQYCHTRTEQQFHPEIYKSTKCNDMLEHGYCPRAVFCAFAHHDTELHVQRTPYMTSCQTSPKEQCSPNTNGGETHPFGSPNSANGGSSTPSYSSVLKQRHSMSSKQDLISSSYPKAPGFERGPLSPNRMDTELGRLRAQSLNMGHLDMATRKEFTGIHPASSRLSFDGLPGTSLPSHSSLCRSDSGFHVTGNSGLSGTLEELNLDLPPIEEHNRPLSDLFGSTHNINYNQMSSPMRIPGADSFHTSPMTSFGESLFGTSKQQEMSSPQTVFGGFDSNDSNGMNEMHNNFIDMQMQNRLQYDVAGKKWEESLKQARQACEAWRDDAQLYRNKCEQLTMERDRAIYERDQLAQQMETFKMHLNNAGIANLPPMAQSMNLPPPDFSENVLRAAMNQQQQQPFNMFSSDSDSMVSTCSHCGRDRSRHDIRNGCPMCS